MLTLYWKELSDLVSILTHFFALPMQMDKNCPPSLIKIANPKYQKIYKCSTYLSFIYLLIVFLGNCRVLNGDYNMVTKIMSTGFTLIISVGGPMAYDTLDEDTANKRIDLFNSMSQFERRFIGNLQIY